MSTVDGCDWMQTWTKKTLLPQLWLHSYIFNVSFHFASVSTYFAYFSHCSPLSFSCNFNLLYAIIVSSPAILFFYFVGFVFSSPTTARIYSMAEYQDLGDSLTRKNIADLLARFKGLRTFFSSLILFTLIYGGDRCKMQVYLKSKHCARLSMTLDE